VALVVFALAMVFSYICSVRLTKPLQEMATAVRRFGQGEFDVRVQDPGKTEEVAQLATAFNNMADSLAQSETRRQEFVANISHELKTPMTTISGFTDGILDGTIPPEKSREYLQVVSAETKRLARLVRKMLDISKLQSKQNVVGHEQFDLCEIMCQMLLSLEGKINARHLDMDVQMPEEPVKVWGEPDAITQVGYNLMDNAIKFSPEGGVIGLQIATKDGKAYVTVCNRGPTIPAEELPLIFDRFHKSDKSRSMDKDGVGLGLYIVKTILNNHKEDITVTSENGVTSFTFTMTLAR
jgi:signal transduction histidine kinase